MVDTRVRAMVDTAVVVAALLRAMAVRAAATVVEDTAAVIPVRPAAGAGIPRVAEVVIPAEVAADTPVVDIANLYECVRVAVNEVNDRGEQGVLNGTPSLFLTSLLLAND